VGTGFPSGIARKQILRADHRFREMLIRTKESKMREAISDETGAPT
jgi:hypothetical protein